jgi:hypothetical protein
MDKILIIGLGMLVVGFIIGGLVEKWKYYKKTGKHLQDLD